MRKGQVKTAQPGEDKAQGDLNHVFKYMKGACENNRTRPFSVLSRDRTRCYGHKLKHKRFELNICGFFFFFFLL